MSYPYVRPEIAALQGYTPGEQPQQGKFVKLNTNENPYPPSARAIQAIGEATGDRLARYPDPVASLFRQVAAQHWDVTPEWVICGNGSDDLLTIVTRAFVGQGEVLRTAYPSYILYRTLAEIQGARCDEIHFTADWQLEDTFTAGDPAPRLAILANPNSPSGTVIAPEDVLRLAERLPCPLLVDEAYADFADDHCMKLVAENEKIMVSRSFSKGYALAGLRFGYLVAQPQVIAELMKVKDSYNCDTLSIVGAAAALQDQAWLAQTCQKIRATRQRLAERMTEMGFSVQPSQANFLWCTHVQRDLRAVYEGLKQRQVLVRYMDYPAWGDGLRITVGTDEQIDALVTVLQSLIESNETAR